MKNIVYLILIFFFLSASGCSMPSVAAQKQLYSFTREEKKIKGAFGKKEVLVKDFRENKMHEEDMEGLKGDIEEYISAHPDLSETAKNNLRELKVTEGGTKAEVELLLGEPDKISRAGKGTRYDTEQIWVYKINKIRAVTVFIIPVFFVHEGYYLYFKDDILAGIEKHTLKQVVQQGSAPGVFVRP